MLRAQEEQRLARIAKAKLEAPPDKEPLDVELVKRSARTGTLGVMSGEELVAKLEDLYYVDHPSYRTNQELIELIRLLADYD